MDDASLCQLIRDALHSPEQAEALAKLIDQLPKIKNYLGKGWLPYYDQALPTTERDVQRNISRFPQMYRLDMAVINCKNPSEAALVSERFIKWVVMILTRDCQDVKRRRVREPIIVSMGDLKGGEDSLTIEETIADDLTLTGIGKLIEEERRFLSNQIRCYIEEDPEMRLRNCHPRNRPNTNCQILSQKLLLAEPPLTRRQVARELGVPEPTVYDRWQNYCLPLLQQIARELGFQ